MPRYPANESGYLSLQINIICLLLALVGVTIITQHPNWFGGVPANGGISVSYPHRWAAIGLTRSDCDVIVQFWEWYERRYAGAHRPVANLALDKCKEAFLSCNWEVFAYWHAIFVRERPPENRRH